MEPEPYHQQDSDDRKSSHSAISDTSSQVTTQIMASAGGENGAEISEENKRIIALKSLRTQYIIGQVLAIFSLSLISSGFFTIAKYRTLALALFTSGGALLAFTLLIPLALKLSQRAYYFFFRKIHCLMTGIKEEDIYDDRFQKPSQPTSIKPHAIFLLSTIIILEGVFLPLAVTDVWKFKEGISPFGGMAWFQTFIILAAISLPLVVLKIQNSHRYHKDLSDQWTANKLTKKVNIPAGILYVLTGCLAIFGLMTTFESSRNWLIDGLKDKGFGTLNISQSDGIKMIVTAAVFGICIFLFLRNYRYHKVYSSFLNNAQNASNHNVEHQLIDDSDDHKQEESLLIESDNVSDVAVNTNPEELHAASQHI
jgi:hypothetical protein